MNNVYILSFTMIIESFALMWREIKTEWIRNRADKTADDSYYFYSVFLRCICLLPFSLSVCLSSQKRMLYMTDNIKAKNLLFSHMNSVFRAGVYCSQHSSFYCMFFHHILVLFTSLKYKVIQNIQKLQKCDALRANISTVSSFEANEYEIQAVLRF